LPLSLRQSLNTQAQLMGLPLTGETSAYWYMARAGGIVAYLLLWLSVVWGLALSGKLATNRVPAPVVYGLHQFLSLGAVVFALLHSLVLLGDNYINFSLINVMLPYTAPYQPFWTGLGTIGFYLITALTVSFYVRKKIGQQTWRALHYLTFAGFALVLTHGLMAGTDTSLPIIKLMYLTTGGLVLFLTLYRLLTPKRKPIRAINR
jgi:predicted ferric reductase